MEITNIYAILSKDQELAVISAKIDGEIHYTADHRDLSGNLWGVFSDRTKDGMTQRSTEDCVELGIYTKHPIKHTAVEKDHYIWVKLDMGNLKYTR